MAQSRGAAGAAKRPDRRTPKRPKICLVLSGGGARGAAHVGVLKVLEEYRVPIHCIAGTSMGALVGAGYATGQSVAEMDEIIRRDHDRTAVQGEAAARGAVDMRRKPDDYTALFGPEIGVGGGKFKLPKGVVTGVQLETVLRRLIEGQGLPPFRRAADSVPRRRDRPA